MALREIRVFDDPCLRKKCKKITNVDEKTRCILDDMVETMHNKPNAGGLAASQVGILKRLVVIDLDQKLLKLVNPEIIDSEGDQFELEGCLSFPGKWGKVHRPNCVTVKAQNEEGKEIIINGTGLMAKCLCHEIDHLNGIVFIDIASEMERT